MVLDIDEERRRISLGIKQCRPNPWGEFAQKYAKSDRIKGNIKSITDFGIFIGLEGGIDGLVHLSDISWNEPGETAVRRYSKGEEIETLVLSIDPERERISLGIKQLDQDPFTDYAAANDRGSVVKGTIQSVEPKEAQVLLAAGCRRRFEGLRVERRSRRRCAQCAEGRRRDRGQSDLGRSQEPHDRPVRQGEGHRRRTQRGQRAQAEGKRPPRSDDARRSDQGANGPGTGLIQSV